MPDKEFVERRRFSRFSIAIPLTYCSLDSSKINQAQTHDISVQGIGFITNDELAPQTSLDIWLNMPDNAEQIHIKGEVVWSKKIGFNNYRIGISLRDSTLKPIPLVLRAIQTKL